MNISSIVTKDETGFNKMWSAANDFEEQNVLEALIKGKYPPKKICEILSYVRICQGYLNIESMELSEFSETFLEEYATNNNKCFETAEMLIRRIGRTVTRSGRLFRKFCPVTRSREGKGEVQLAIDCTRLRRREFYGDLFGSEACIEPVQTLLHEITTYFYHLVTTLALCKDMIRKEAEVRKDGTRLMEIFKTSCERELDKYKDLFRVANNVSLISPEEMAERRKHARPLKEWLAEGYHKHDRKWMLKEAIWYREQSGQQYGLDEKASLLWSRNPEWGKHIIDVINRLDSLDMEVRKSKKAEKEGKKGTFSCLEMVYFIKYSEVSYLNEEGELVDERKERHFYDYLNEHYKGDYMLPEWAGVCKERKFCYEHNISLEEMKNCFKEHLEKDIQAA